MPNLTSKDWVRMLIAFLLGVAVTLLVIQLTGGKLFQGALTESLYIAPTTETTDTRTDTRTDDEKTTLDDETKDLERTDELKGEEPVVPTESAANCGNAICEDEEDFETCPADCLSSYDDGPESSTSTQDEVACLDAGGTVEGCSPDSGAPEGEEGAYGD